MKLRNLRDEDFNLLMRLFTDSSVRKYLGGPLSSAEAEKRANELLRDKPERYWIIQVENISIGAIIFGHHVDSGETEVSYLLLPEQTGKGYAQEAVQTALKRVKGKMVVAETQARNMRSRRLLERLGFEEAERLKRFGEQQVYYERRLSDNQSQ